jgi:ADP-heptose:LPS heptosyltransferase
MRFQDIRPDCAHFTGHHPCKPHILYGSTCDQPCTHYRKTGLHILIIQLGAMGDVIRATPLITAYRKRYPDCRITWLTDFPELVPRDELLIPLQHNFENLFTVLHTEYAIAVNLEKEPHTAMLLKKVQAQRKYGFSCENNVIVPVNEWAQHKYLTGIDNTYSRQNTKSYLTEIFELCQLEYAGEKILLNRDERMETHWRNTCNTLRNGKPVLVVHTGAGARWPTRLWPLAYFSKFIEQSKKDYFVILAGGEAEDEQNKQLSGTTGVFYPGVLPVSEYLAVLENAAIVVTAVSMTLHLAAALSKKTILFNNIFNRNEFSDYDNVHILEPSTGCDCYYGSTCKRETCCMYDISVDTVLEALKTAQHE